MPRDLGDVLHYFMPNPRADGVDRGGRTERGGQPPAALPIVTLPIGDHDVVRAAFAWNLTVEMARLGASACLIAPLERRSSAIWPEEGCGPVGAEALFPHVDGIEGLARAALDVAVARAADSREGGVVVVCTPPSWLVGAGAASALVRWVLLFATTDTKDLLEAYALAKPLLLADETNQVGITIHGARRIDEAEQAFRRVAGVSQKHLGRSPLSYGLLVDDLHVYRAIVARRPIGLEHPQSRAARALRDVAGLVLEDARQLAHA